MLVKQKVFQQFLALIKSQITAYEATLKDLAETAANETKSTAGDKHETALAMIQIEQRNIKMRLQESVEKKNQLEKINPLLLSSSIIKGSLVRTNKGTFYLSVALGKIEMDGESIIAISPESPLGSRFLSGKAKESIMVNNLTYFIQGIE